MSKSPNARLLLWLFLPFFALMLMTVIFTVFDLDRSISENFYRLGDGWYLAKEPLWVWLHKKGTIPGIVFSVGCLLIWLLSYFAPSLETWRKPCMVVVLTVVLGCGLLANAILKQYWGRPRPSQTVEYGGYWEYRPVFPPGTPGQGASFPSGHSTMGFMFLAAAAFYPRSKSLAIGGVVTGVGLGTLISAGRVVQGSHFVSDTIWSFGLVGMTAAGLILLLPEPRGKIVAEKQSASARRKRTWGIAATIFMILVVAGVFLTTRPFYRTRSYPMEIPAAFKAVNIQIDHEPERLRILYTDQSHAELRVDAYGYGWLKFNYRQKRNYWSSPEQLNVKLAIEANSYFAKLDHDLTLSLPATYKDRVTLMLNQQPVSTIAGALAVNQ